MKIESGEPGSYVYYVCRNVFASGHPYLKVQVDERGMIFELSAKRGFEEKFTFTTKRAALEYAGRWLDPIYKYKKAYKKYLKLTVIKAKELKAPH